MSSPRGPNISDAPQVTSRFPVANARRLRAMVGSIVVATAAFGALAWLSKRYPALRSIVHDIMGILVATMVFVVARGLRSRRGERRRSERRQPKRWWRN